MLGALLLIIGVLSLFTFCTKLKSFMVIILTCNVLFIIGAILICVFCAKGIKETNDLFAKGKCGVEMFKKENDHFIKLKGIWCKNKCPCKITDFNKWN